MSAYLIVDTKITDPDSYEEYKRQVKPLIESHGGQYLARGGEMDLRETELWGPTRMVLIAFPDMATAQGFLDDARYQPIKAIRKNSAQSTVVLVEGL